MTNTFLFARDGYRCQYCGRHRAALRGREFLTRDHVLPASRGGDNSWDNVVTACSPCNNRKASHLPAEIGMHLRRVGGYTPEVDGHPSAVADDHVVGGRFLRAIDRAHGGRELLAFQHLAADQRERDARLPIVAVGLQIVRGNGDADGIADAGREPRRRREATTA